MKLKHSSSSKAQRFVIQLYDHAQSVIVHKNWMLNKLWYHWWNLRLKNKTAIIHDFTRRKTFCVFKKPAGKVLVAVIWNNREIIMIGYFLDKSRTVSGKYYFILLIVERPKVYCFGTTIRFYTNHAAMNKICD